MACAAFVWIHSYFLDDCKAPLYISNRLKMMDTDNHNTRPVFLTRPVSSFVIPVIHNLGTHLDRFSSTTNKTGSPL